MLWLHKVNALFIFSLLKFFNFVSQKKKIQFFFSSLDHSKDIKLIKIFSLYSQSFKKYKTITLNKILLQ